ncbi:MurR/RpiR family transcriptional regulator [Phyllobacterium lublinensis]|uniref:MurR/RpiR family transcriptional regulator n=1 Tax=Phyllobacterium lublinensis TaxID=2875708 RepID=UPI001CCF2CF1|nr:MurR/RpiR family transcriptional regulator [Phyllobacterium sp. 2063]MBZ9655909.1 MurR/RpiR family transcriptional regulator [Phyllobacterium sp. 2063]
MAAPHFDIVARLREIADTGQRSDQRVAAAILSDADFATHASIERLAEKAGVSEPTITRFCRMLGFQGTREFKVKLAQSLAVAGRFIVAPPAPEFKGNDIPSTIAKSAKEAIDTVGELIDREDLLRAAAIITDARMVRAYGSGGASSMAATELENRLFRLGIQASSHIDGEMQQMTAATSDKGTAIVAYSLSGELKPLIEAVTIAGRYGAKTIALTAPNSSLAAAAQLVLPFHINEGTNVYRPSPARYALLALTDMLAMTVAEMIGAPAVERMRRIKNLQGMHKSDAPNLPLGD